MPYAIRKVRKQPCYRVYNSKTKRTYAKCTTKTNAEKQIRLLRAIENNKDFVPLAQQKNSTRKTRKNRNK